MAVRTRAIADNDEDEIWGEEQPHIKERLICRRVTLFNWETCRAYSRQRQTQATSLTSLIPRIADAVTAERKRETGQVVRTGKRKEGIMERGQFSPSLSLSPE